MLHLWFHSPNFAKKKKWIYFLSLSGAILFLDMKKITLTDPWETHMLFLKKLEGHRSISTSLSMAPPTISSNASICYNIEVEFWDNWGSRRTTKRLTRLFLGLQPPGSPLQIAGCTLHVHRSSFYHILEYSIGGQACHLNRSPLLDLFHGKNLKETWTHDAFRSFSKKLSFNCYSISPPLLPWITKPQPLRLNVILW